MVRNVCTVCGKQFESNSKSLVCGDCKDKPAICVVCGKEFIRKHPYTAKTCSSKCRGIYRKQSGASQQAADKMKQTKMERYGTLDPSKVSAKKNGALEPRICPICGKLFTPKSVRQVYCNDTHYGPCPVCGKLVEIKELHIGPRACSEECRRAQINATCLERYGSKDAITSEHAKQLARETSLKKYGKEHYMQTDEARQRVEATNLTKYGTQWPMQNEELRKKAASTNLTRYGKEWYIQTDEFKQKYSDKMKSKYGGFGLASPALKDKVITTNKIKYGCKWPGQNEEIKQKARISLRNKYNAFSYLSSREGLMSRIKDSTKVDNYLAFKSDPERFINEHFNDKPTIAQLSEILGVSDTPIYDILVKANKQELTVRREPSHYEHEIEQFLREITGPSCNMIRNDRKVIAPKELDFYLPEFNLAIECNPTTTHNSTVNTWGPDEAVKPYNYHQIKSREAEDKGVFLFHIFGYEWIHKRDIIKSMIANLIGRCSYKVYARNTTVVEVPYNESKAFLLNNHRQGNCASKIRLGLVDNSTNELVSLMTFSKTRPGMGKKEADDCSTYELTRFCSKLNTSVVGGASKLLSYFERVYKPNKVISFSDVAHTKGNLYSRLGFSKVSVSEPGYVWVKPYGEIVKSRVSCQKKFLPNMFEDVTESDLASLSERDIMVGHGFVQVFDCGVVRWEKCY